MGATVTPHRGASSERAVLASIRATAERARDQLDAIVSPGTSPARRAEGGIEAEAVAQPVQAGGPLRDEDSARAVMTTAQLLTAGGLLLATIVCVVLAPSVATFGLTASATAVCLLTALLRIRLTARGAGMPRGVRVGPWKLASLDDRELPIYSVLVPLHYEAGAVPRLVAALRALDYPIRRLDVLMICERDDEETLAALRAERLGAQFRIVTVPDSNPKTRSKALDAALAHARGELVVVFVAGDEPDPDQLKQALLVLGSAPADVACVQAKLDCANAEQNLLTRWLAADRAAWFDRVLPALRSIRVPLPLGASSAHFRMKVLRELGGWDAFNAADDAGLGVRLRRRGYRALLLESFTFEQVTPSVGDFSRRCSSASKGQIQTWLVQMRHPLLLRRELGWRGWSAFQLTVGGSVFAALATPICWLLLCLWLIDWIASLGSLPPAYVFYAAAAILLVCSVTPAYGVGTGDGSRGLLERVQLVCFSPLYWALVSISAWRGACQLLTRPAYWKTSLTRYPAAAVHVPDTAR